MIKSKQTLKTHNIQVSSFIWHIYLPYNGLYPNSLYLCVSPRSRPVIHVIRDISIDPQFIDLEQYNCKGREGVW